MEAHIKTRTLTPKLFPLPPDQHFTVVLLRFARTFFWRTRNISLPRTPDMLCRDDPPALFPVTTLGSAARGQSV